MQTNISTTDIFSLLGQPVRIQIILIIHKSEACVCHMEAILGIRQAGISQHLMTLRDAGLVKANRQGRNIFYKLANPDLYQAVVKVAEAAGVNETELQHYAHSPVENCPCPKCNPGIDPELSCRKMKSKKTLKILQSGN